MSCNPFGNRDMQGAGTAETGAIGSTGGEATGGVAAWCAICGAGGAIGGAVDGEPVDSAVCAVIGVVVDSASAARVSDTTKMKLSY